jgi:hypothetical protein
VAGSNSEAGKSSVASHEWSSPCRVGFLLLGD